MKLLLIVAAMLGVVLSSLGMADDVRVVYEPTTEQRALAATLYTPPMPAGRNVFPMLAAFADVPKPTADEKKVLCARDTVSCLALVRQHTDVVREVMARHARTVVRVESIATYDLWWNTTEPDPAALKVPQVSPILLFWPTLAALRFVDGDPAGGLTTACTAAATLRRMHTTSNTLIDSMVTLGGARRALHLSAELLAAKPVAMPVPEICRTAFAAPEANDVDFRGAMDYEFRFLKRGLSDEGLAGTEYAIVAPLALLASERATLAMLGDEVMPDAAFRAALPDVADVARVPHLRTARDGAEQLARTYMDRSADYVAAIRMAGLALWLNDHRSTRPLSDRLVAAPMGVLSKRVKPACGGTCLALLERNPLSPGQTWPISRPL